MTGGVYILCAIGSLACSLLLFRGFRKSHVRLLFWSSLCFALLAVDNFLLYVDVKVIPNTDLSLVRHLPGLVGLVLLIYGLVWDSA